MPQHLAKIALLHAVISPYKVTLFNRISEQLPNLEVIYFSVSESMRAWVVNSSDMRHRHVVLNQGNRESHSPIKMAWQVWRTLNQIRPDMVVITEYIYLPYWIGLIWAICHRKKRVFFSESTALDRPRSVWKEFIKRLFVRQFHAGIAQGSQAKAYMTGLGIPTDKIGVKGYSTDNEFYETGARHARENRPALIQKWGLSGTNILFVGRLAPEKNLDTLFRAFHSISSDYPDWGLMIVGSGPLESELKQIALKLRIPVQFIPFLQRDEMPVMYGLGDIFVLPSRSEPWGLVVNEAMSAGLPVIVSNRAGSAYDLVTPDTGIVIDPDRVDDLALALARLMGDSRERVRLGEGAKSLVADFSVQKSADRTAAMLIQALDIKIGSVAK